MASYQKRSRNKPMAEINVVPYIDVMLVLMIIFMITAPLLTQGVQVDLPQASAEPVTPEENKEPLVVSVDAEGLFYVAIGDNQDQPVSAETMLAKVGAVIRRNPKTPIMVKGDTAVSYGKVITVMALLQKAGAPSVGLITQPIESNAVTQ